MKIQINDLPKWRSPSPEKILLEDVFGRADWVNFYYSIPKSISITDSLKEAFHLIWCQTALNFDQQTASNIDQGSAPFLS